MGLGWCCFFLLRLVLRLCLSALERFIHVLGRLVGLAVVVDRHLGFAFLGDAHHLVAVGIYAGGLRFALFGIILQVYGTVVATPVLALTDEYLFPGEVVSLFLLVKRDMVPLCQTLGVAVGVVPVVFEALPGLLLALLPALLCLLCLLLVLLTVLSRVDKGDVTLGGVVLQVGGEFLSVGEFDVLFLDKTAVLSMPICCIVRFILATFCLIKILSTGMLSISFVRRSMLTRHLCTSPVAGSLRSTALPRLPVLDNSTLSSAVNV